MVEKLIGKLKTYYTLNKTKENDSKIGADVVSKKDYDDLMEKLQKSEAVRKTQKDLIYSMRKEMQSKDKN